MPLAPVDKIWMDGELVDWNNAQIHVLTHALHYGLGVFEGIRTYETSQGPAVFRLTDHIRRLFRSAHLYQIDMPFSPEAMIAGTYCVSIWMALFGPTGRESSIRPAHSGCSTVACDQKNGVKNATGPLKFPVLRNKVQHWFPVGTFFPAVVVLGFVSGNGR